MKVINEQTCVDRDHDIKDVKGLVTRLVNALTLVEKRDLAIKIKPYEIAIVEKDRPDIELARISRSVIL